MISEHFAEAVLAIQNLVAALPASQLLTLSALPIILLLATVEWFHFRRTDIFEVRDSAATVHLDDFEAQADRMLVNVAALLEGQGAGFGDVVSAITYLKHPDDAARLRQKFREAGYEGFPNVLVEAPVCRPERPV